MFLLLWLTGFSLLQGFVLMVDDVIVCVVMLVKWSDIAVGLAGLPVGFFYGGFGWFSVVVDCLCFTGLLRFCLC